MDVDVVDPHANSKELEHEYGFGLVENPGSEYDAVIVAVNHDEYVQLTEADLNMMLKDDKGVIVDIKGVFRGKINKTQYWSL